MCTPSIMFYYISLMYIINGSKGLTIVERFDIVSPVTVPMLDGRSNFERDKISIKHTCKHVHRDVFMQCTEPRT